MSRFDAQQVFQGHSEKWKAEEQRLNAEYKMNMAEPKSEAQIYSLQSAGANRTAHEFKQALIQEQQISLSEMRSEMKQEEASILALAQQRVSEIICSEHEALESAIVFALSYNPNLL